MILGEVLFSLCVLCCCCCYGMLFTKQEPLLVSRFWVLLFLFVYHSASFLFFSSVLSLSLSGYGYMFAFLCLCVVRKYIYLIIIVSVIGHVFLFLYFFSHFLCSFSLFLRGLMCCFCVRKLHARMKNNWKPKCRNQTRTKRKGNNGMPSKATCPLSITLDVYVLV